MTKSKSFLSKLTRFVPFLGEDDPLVSVIELNGVIGASGGPGRKALTHAKLEKTIAAAFKPAKLSAVALAINSPGGSPVQSRMILNEIRRRAEEKKVPVLAFVEDVGASGGYILALAGDEIYADESSIVGSIGVIAAGFGFAEAIARIGVERRVQTAGESKSTLDPFKPENPEEKARMQEILDELHDQFIALVRARRPGKLNEEGEKIFTGAFWTAPKAKELGLIDDIAQLGDLLRARFGDDVKINRVAPEGGSLLRRLLSGGDASGGLIEPDAMLEAAEHRSMWARFGL